MCEAVRFLHHNNLVNLSDQSTVADDVRTGYSPQIVKDVKESLFISKLETILTDTWLRIAWTDPLFSVALISNLEITTPLGNMN